MTDAPIRVLFICTHNSARSQIAEALLSREPGFAAWSAGTEVTRVNPLAIAVLAEIGIDWRGARSKSVTEFLDAPVDHVVTVCDSARDSCPVLPGARNTLHWSLEDPAAAQGSDEDRLAAFRRTRDEISERLRPFIEAARG